MQVDLCVFHAPPEPLGEDTVEGSAFAIHANLHLLRQEDLGVLRTGKMAALIVIPNRRSGGGQGPFRGRYDKCVISKISESSQTTTNREYQSMMAARYGQPGTSRILVTSILHT